MKNLLLGALLCSVSIFANTDHINSHESTNFSPANMTSHTSPYRPGNIRTSSVEYHPTKKYFYYPLMNQQTKKYDTIIGKSREDVQYKVNNYNNTNETNWIGVICLCSLVGGVSYLIYKLTR